MLRPRRLSVWRARWHRFQRDERRSPVLRSWLPSIAVTSLLSSAVVVTAAIHTERITNDLLARFATEKIGQIAADLEAETKDWAIWDETHRFLEGRNPGYFQRNYNAYSFARSPFVAVFDRHGRLTASARFNARHQQIERLGPETERQLAGSIPAGNPRGAITVLARFQGQPYLMSVQPVLASGATGTSNGRLMFVRPLASANPDRSGLQRALGILSEHYLPPGRSAEALQPASAPLLAPLQIHVPHRDWQGRAPLSQVILRTPRERIAAVLSIAGLLLGGLVLVSALRVHAGQRQRASRLQSLRSEQARRWLNRALAHRRSHDALTGLLNDAGLAESMGQQRQQFADFLQAVLVFDLDHFAVVNSGLGRSGGDAVLQAFGRQLQATCHPSACVARLAADQFACGVVGTSEPALRSEVASLSQRLNDLELQIDGHTVNLTASVGACMLGDGDVSQALHQATIACSLVKLAGGRGHQFFGDERASTVSYLDMQRMNEALVAAIKGGRIALHGQHAWLLSDPQLPAVYVELLARICPAEGGSPHWSEPMVEAARFCGSLTLLDEHVLALGLEQIGTVLHDPELAHRARGLVFALNITADTLLSPALPERLNALLDQHGVPPGQLCLELTEQAALRDPQAAIVRMHQLRRLGLRLSLDDFGTGTTALGYLRDLPLDYVKIDKRFIWTLQEESASRLIVQFVVELGREIGFQTVAEGVEDVALLLELQQLGISTAQGYLTTRPRPFLSNDGPWVFADAGHTVIGATRGRS